MILKLLGWQGIAGIAASLALAVLLFVQKGETRHWKKQSAGFEQLYHDEETAFAATVANRRAAADGARALDQANAARVTAEQRAITERTSHDYEIRLAAARAAAERLRVAAQAPADSRARGSASMSGLPAAGTGPAEAARQDQLPFRPREVATSRGSLEAGDALIATEQAIQLDELIKWVERQAAVDPNSKSPPH